MGEITLVRHGQANSAADNEADYDRLTELGHTQAKWLGEWMRAHDGPFDHVVSGSLRRQRKTVANMGWEAEVDERLNEITYYDLTAEMDALGLTDKRIGPEDFATHFPATLQAWKEGKIKGTETFDAFTSRVAEVIAIRVQSFRRISSNSFVRKMSKCFASKLASLE